MARGDGFRIDIDLSQAEREAARIRDLLSALRKRHDLARFEFTQHVRIVPAGPTHSHPILTLGTRFAETEDLLLATYIHEQMHWYLWQLGGPDHDPVAPFFDELVRRYPKAPTRLPEGARNYEQTYLHLVVCWLEIEALSELIGRERAIAIADTQWGYRWIYRTVIADAEPLGRLYREHGIVPILSPQEVAATAGRLSRQPSDGPRKRLSAARLPRPPRIRRTPRARDGRSRG
ncbi:MAG: hypothetical protein ACM31O_07910 [Bacteroidota bacterium]